MKASLCPVCNGSGTYKWSYSIDTVAERTAACHGCGGKGWVEVQEEGWPHSYHPPVDCSHDQRRDTSP